MFYTESEVYRQTKDQILLPILYKDIELDFFLNPTNTRKKV